LPFKPRCYDSYSYTAMECSHIAFNRPVLPERRGKNIKINSWSTKHHPFKEPGLKVLTK